jgi:hypothetical protein
MATSAPDLFTTLRYIPSALASGPTKEDIPLFDLHVSRLENGYREWSGLRESGDNTAFWASRIWNALDNVIIDKGSSHHLRVSLRSVLSSQPRAETPTRRAHPVSSGSS